MNPKVIKIGKRGTIMIPASLSQRHGFQEDNLVIIEAYDHGILIRPPVTAALSIKNYTREQQAEFILSNAVDTEDYQKTRETVSAMGLNPDNINHFLPPTRHFIYQTKYRIVEKRYV